MKSGKISKPNKSLYLIDIATESEIVDVNLNFLFHLTTSENLMPMSYLGFGSKANLISKKVSETPKFGSSKDQPLGLKKFGVKT